MRRIRMTRARRKPNVPAGGSWTAEKQHDRGNALPLSWGSSISLVLSQGVPHYTKHESHDIIIIIVLGVGKNVNIICKIIQKHAFLILRFELNFGIFANPVDKLSLQ